MSSWSMPIMLAPFRSSTPITRSETFCMRISLPIGRLPAEELADQRLADEADLAAVADVVIGEGFPFVELFPVADDQERGACVPQMYIGTQFLLP